MGARESELLEARNEAGQGGNPQHRQKHAEVIAEHSIILPHRVVRSLPGALSVIEKSAALHKHARERSRITGVNTSSETYEYRLKELQY
jgi:hypothetical protein